MRRVILACLLAVVAGTALAARAPHADAHAAIESTDPSNGELLDQAPAEIVMRFTEPTDLALTTVGVVDDAGAPVPTGPPEHGQASAREIHVPVDPLEDGVYTVTWRTVSATDGHVTSGAFSFGVGVSPGDVTPIERSGSETPPPTPLSVAGRWALYVGLVVLLGAAAAGLVAFGPTIARPWLLGLAWALASIGVVVMTLAERAAVDVPLGTLLSSEAGAKLLVLAAAVGITGLAVLAVVLRPARWTLLALGVTAAGAMLARAAGGHAAGSLATVSAQWLHLVGVGTWIGGLAWLLIGLRERVDPEEIRRLSTLAGIGLVIVVVSGVLRSSNELGVTWWLHPFENSYSTALVLKLAVVVPLVTLGAVNRYRNVARVERLGSRPLLRTAGAEVALAAVILGTTGVLSGLPPQQSAEPATQQRPVVVSGSDFATTTSVELSISPGTVGPNTFEADVTDFDTGQPLDARRVSLTFELPQDPDVGSMLRLRRTGDGTWRATGTALAQQARWTVTVLVETGGGSVEVPLQVTPMTPGQRIDVSRMPGQPDLYTITLAEGREIQAYVDPGRAGRTNQVHVTAFDAEGAELPLHAVMLGVTPPDADPFEPEMMRFGQGHFAANIDLSAGTWTFDITAHAEDGQVLTASFEQTFEG